jgi:predicted permease
MRMFSRQRGFAIAAVMTIALGVGANSAIFSVVHGVLLQSLPYKDADRLYRLRTSYPDGRVDALLSPPDFMSVREANRVFDQVEAYTSGAVTMVGAGEPQEVRVTSISHGMFELLGLHVPLGRAFEEQEHLPGRNTVAVLDHGFWQRAFGGDGGVIGRAITIGGARYFIVGVLAPKARLPADVPGARVPSDADVYLPLEYGEAFSSAAVAQRRSKVLGVLARARTGATPFLVSEDLRRIGAQLEKAFPETNERVALRAISARDLIVGDVRKALLVLFGAVGFVLLVACANVASLMLARASARGSEMQLRAALGARRGRLLRLLLTEAGMLGLLGGALGLALAYAGIKALVAAQPADIPRLHEISLDGTVVSFALAITLLSSFAFGALPALQATGDLTGALRTSPRAGGHDRRAGRFRATLVVAEVALAVVLLAGAVLFVRSLAALTRVDPGFQTDRAMSFRVSLFGRGYNLNVVRTRVTEYETALQRQPGVRSVAATSVLPLSGVGQRLAFSVDGAATPLTDVNLEIGVTSVTPAFLKTIGASLLEGRDFTDADGADAPLVAIVNEAAVRHWFRNGEPIGKHVQANGTRQIVGVVADVLQGAPSQPTAPQLFVPYAQKPTRTLWFVVRTGPEPQTLVPSVRATIRSFDPNIAVSELTFLDQLQAATVARPRFYAMLLTLFAALALTLAVTGIFGVMSYTVAERAGDIGIRMALGARRADVLRMIVGRAVVLGVAGATIGLAAAFALGRVVQNQLFGVGILDPWTLCIVILILLTSVAAGSFLPAQRAARLDPSGTLRQG